MILSKLSFQALHKGVHDENILEDINTALMEEANNSGKFFITHTKLNNKFVIKNVYWTNKNSA